MLFKATLYSSLCFFLQYQVYNFQFIPSVFFCYYILRLPSNYIKKLEKIDNLYYVYNVVMYKEDTYWNVLLMYIYSFVYASFNLHFHRFVKRTFKDKDMYSGKESFNVHTHSP